MTNIESKLVPLVEEASKIEYQEPLEMLIVVSKEDALQHAELIFLRLQLRHFKGIERLEFLLIEAKDNASAYKAMLEYQYRLPELNVELTD